ncbi:natural killer cell receptor 2B4 [Catharus ustulatus]|uniref:natural killer cell receptor 2B4 n=1 Tax=Catharus ustulatus TaxID=91951 RepID=UPI00140BE94D|nr:natural killer cell receptor 2B4 [Catharus ustulatus]
MSPRCPRCPPVLLALLLGLAWSQGSQECRDQAVTAGGSLCLVPEEPAWEWGEMHWKAEMDSGSQQQILTASRDGDVSYPKGPFLGRAEFQPGNLSLCISPINKTESGVYRVEFKSSSGIFQQCFRVSVWDPIPEPSLQSQILQRDRGRCLLSLLCSSPANGNISISWECPGDLPEFQESPGSNGTQRFQWIPENAEPQICHCNLSNPAGWRAAPAPLTCPEISGNFDFWKGLKLVLDLVDYLVMVVAMLMMCYCCSR